MVLFSSLHAVIAKAINRTRTALKILLVRFIAVSINKLIGENFNYHVITNSGYFKMSLCIVALLFSINQQFERN